MVTKKRTKPIGEPKDILNTYGKIAVAPRDGQPIVSIVPEIQELERIASWTLDTLHSKNGTTPTDSRGVVVAIQTRGRKFNCLGAFETERWETINGEGLHEITVSAERLTDVHHDNPDAATSIASVAIHEAVHAYHASIGVKSTSKGGHHNAKFRETAEQLGLLVAEPSDATGHSHTSVSDELAKTLRQDFKLKGEVFNKFRVAKTPKESSDRHLKLYTFSCGCGEMKASRENLDATCNTCDQPFESK